MGRLKTGTICSKHEKIYALANQIQDLASACLEDGQNMERGLNDKKDRIADLEAEVRDLQKEINIANSRIESLEDEVQYLYGQIEDLRAEA